MSINASNVYNDTTMFLSNESSKIINNSKHYGSLILDTQSTVNNNTRKTNRDGKSRATVPYLSNLPRCSSVDNFYSTVPNSQDSYEQQSISCFSDCNVLSDSSTPRPPVVFRGSLPNSRRWRSEIDIGRAADMMTLKLPSVKVLASKFDGLQCEKNDSFRSKSFVNLQNINTINKLDWKAPKNSEIVSNMNLCLNFIVCEIFCFTEHLNELLKHWLDLSWYS